MKENEPLAEFQAALLELLDEPLSADEIISRLQNDAVFAPYRRYIDTFEPRMVEVAAELIKKWGRRSPGNELE